MRKVLASLLVAAMVLGLVGTAFAGFSDAANNKYIDKVAAFKWVNGYPDGTFKPEGAITRAEASAVVVRALGLEAAANAAQGLGSKFADVPATHWASGYINVCTTKGIIKGYPDDTFKPEANVTNAEMITMLVRALNRESQAIGEWPIGHITVAAANSIVGSGFAANVPATRGQVAEYAAKAANVKHLELQTNGWVESNKTFVSFNDLTRVVDVKVTSDPNVENRTFDGTYVNAAGTTVAGTFELVSDYIIAGGALLKDLNGYTVTVTKNDDGKVVLVEVSTTTSAKTGTLSLIGADYFYISGDSTKYEVAKVAVAPNNLDVTVKRNESTKISPNTVLSLATSTLAIDDEVEFFMTNGKVTFIKAKVFDITYNVVSSVRTTGDANTWQITTTGTTKTLTSDCVVSLNGTASTLASLKKDMIVNIATNADGYATYIEASDKIAEGQVTAKRSAISATSTINYISVDGVEYRLASPVYRGAVLADITTNDRAKLYLAPNGRATIVDVTATASQYGKVVRFETGTGAYDKWVVDVKGAETTYEVAKKDGVSMHDAIVWAKDNVGGNTLGTPILPGDYVRIFRDSDGRLTYTGIASPAGPDKAKSVYRVVDASVAAEKVVEVYTGDNLVNLATSGLRTIGDSTVVYVNGVHATADAITKDSYVKHITTTAPKMDLVVVDTYATYTASKVASLDGFIIKGLRDATEAESKIEVFKNAAMAVGTELKIQEWKWDLSATLGADATSITTDQTYYASGVTAKWDKTGSFCFKVTDTDAAVKVGATMYLKITDKFGNVTTASVVLK